MTIIRCIQLFMLGLYVVISFPKMINADTGPLVEELAKRNAYKVRPVINEDTVIDVKIEIVPRTILYVSEVQQEIKVTFWMRVQWRDEFFQWNPADYNGTTTIYVDSQLMWHPDIVLYESNAYKMALPMTRSIPLIVRNDGTVLLLSPQIYTTHCKMNLTYYPFDSQMCHLTFGSWAEDGTGIDILPLTSTPESSSYLFNGEWDLTDFTIQRHVLYYSCCPEPYPDVEFTLHLTRRPWFYVINLIVPFVTLTLLSSFVFFIPPESGEKVSLAVTTLLSLVVFTQLVLTTVPAASDGTNPIVGVYFVAAVIIVSVVVVFAVLSLHAYHKKESGRPVPRLIRFLVLSCMGTFCFKLRCLSKRSMTDTAKHDRREANDVKDSGRRDINDNPAPTRQRKFGSSIYNSNGDGNRLQDNGLFFVNAAMEMPEGGSISLDRATPAGRRWPSTTESDLSLIRMEATSREYAQKEEVGGRGNGSQEMSSYEWVEVSRILDRFFLIIFAAMFCLMPLMVFLQLSLLM